MTTTTMTDTQRQEYLSKFRAFWDERENFEGGYSLDEFAKQLYEDGKGLIEVQKALQLTDEEVTDYPVYWAGVLLNQIHS